MTDSADCPKCKTDYNTIYQCERCGSTWSIPDAPVWHDAKEPPKESGWYWKYPSYKVDYYNATSKEWDNDGTHWMPLPQPPTGE